MTDRWDPSNPEHKVLGHQIEIGNGIPEMRHIGNVVKALNTVGFKVEHDEDLAERPDPIPWYYPLEGNIWQAQTLWDLFIVWGVSWSGQLVTHNGIRLLEFARILPKGTYSVVQSMKIAGDSLLKGGQTKVRV
jgi:sterol 24-C-methyltransferase